MLKALQINFSGIRTLPQTKKVSVPIYNQKQDVFVRNNNVSFKGNNVTPFENWMRENGVQIEDIKNIIFDDSKQLGSGNKNTSFNIPNCDDYILRVNTLDLDFLRSADFSTATIEETEDKNLKVNIGQKVESIKVKSFLPYPLEIQVLKKQQGESIGVQPAETLYNEYTGELKPNTLPYEDYSRKEKYQRTLDKVARLPLESYETLISELQQANKAGYVFDLLNSNNLLVDEDNQRINLIDMEKGINATDPMSGLLYALTNISYLKTFTSQYPNPVSEEQRSKAIEDTITIILKFTTAMQNQGAKFDRENISFQAHDVFRSYPCARALQAMNENQVWDVLSQMGIA